jgi:SAM-dependent methyltransferase
VSYVQPTPEEIASRRAALAPYDGWNERAFAALIAWRGMPKSYLDLGSGTGAMVNMARKIGIEAIGVDTINGPEHWFITHDLTQPFDLVDRGDWVVRRTGEFAPGGLFANHPTVRFHLITCLEVGEHLSLDAHPTLCDTIARHLMPGGMLVFSAAPPGQRGEHHVGCRPAYEWRSLLHERGISYRADYTKELALIWALTTGPASAWLGPNLQVFDTWDGDIQQEVG